MDTNKPINRSPGRPAHRAGSEIFEPGAEDSAPATDTNGRPLITPAQPPATYAARAVVVHACYHGMHVELYRADLSIETVERLVDQLMARDGWSAWS